MIPRYDDDPLRLPGQPREPEEGELAEVAAQLRGPAGSGSGASAAAAQPLPAVDHVAAAVW